MVISIIRKCSKSICKAAGGVLDRTNDKADRRIITLNSTLYHQARRHAAPLAASHLWRNLILYMSYWNPAFICFYNEPRSAMKVLVNE